MLSPATCIILYHFASRIEDWAKNGLLVQTSHWITISNHFYWLNPHKIPLKEVEPRIIGRNLMRYALTERNLLSYIRHPFIVARIGTRMVLDLIFWGDFLVGKAPRNPRVSHDFVAAEVRLHHAFQTPSCQGAQRCDPFFLAQDWFHLISMFD